MDFLDSPSSDLVSSDLFHNQFRYDDGPWITNEELEAEPERLLIVPTVAAGAGKLCEAHRNRAGADVPASFLVNGNEAMCKQCFAGVAIFSFEKIGDTEGDIQSCEQKKRYLSHNPQARERRKLRDALERARRKAMRAKNWRFCGLPKPQEPPENGAVAFLCAGNAV